MAGPTDHELDARLRRAARAASDRSARAVDVERDLVAVRDRIDVDPAMRTGGDGNRRWLAAAAAAVLIVGAGVAIVALDRDDQLIDTAAIETTTTLQPVMSPAPVATTIVDVPTSLAAPTTTSQRATSTTTTNPTSFGAASMESATLGPGDVGVLRPAAAVTRNCSDVVHVGRETSGAIEGVGTFSPDGFQMWSYQSESPGCERAESGDAVKLRVPLDLGAGSYLMCVGRMTDPRGCAAVTVTATLTGSAVCTGEPIAPPSLRDGSAPGTAQPVDATTVEWGSGSIAIRQQPSMVTVAADFTETRARLERLVVNGFEAVVTPVAGSLAGPFLIHVRQGEGFCPRTYQLPADVDLFQARVLAQAWLQWYAESKPVPTGLDQPIDAPAEYVGTSWTGEAPVHHRFSPSGDDLGPTEADWKLTSSPSQLSDGRSLTLAELPPADNGDLRCVERSISITSGSGTNLVHADLTGGTSMLLTPDDYLLVTREACPAGTTWGDPNTVWQLVGLDLSVDQPAPEILLERPVTEMWGFSATTAVASISDDRRYVALWRSTSPHDTAWSLVDLEMGIEVSMPSTCGASATEIVATPTFLRDGSIVVARVCPTGLGTSAVVIDHVLLPVNRLMWGATVAMPMLGYGIGMGVSVASDGDGRLAGVIAVGLPTVEEPNVSILIVGDRQQEISRDPFWIMAFPPA